MFCSSLRQVLPFVVLFVASARSPAAEYGSPAPFSPEGEIRAWMADGRYEKALPLLKKTVRESMDPDLAYAHLYCLYREESYARVLALAQRSPYNLAAAQPRGMILVGLALWRLGRTPQALHSWMRVIAASPKDERAWECIRVAFLSADRRRRTQLAQQLLQDPAMPPFGVSLVKGLLSQLRRNKQDAMKHLTNALELNPDSSTVVRAWLYLLRQTGDRNRAEVFKRWLSERELDATSSSRVDGVDEYGPRGRGLRPLCRLPWPAGQAAFCGSHEGRLETPHKERGRHALGVMIPSSSHVLAARAGRVVSVVDAQGTRGAEEFGAHVMIDHGDGTYARYFHVRGGTVRVRQGELVGQGQVLARPGHSGRCQCRHLHFEVIREAPFSLSRPKIYKRWETVPVDFIESQGLDAKEVPGRWLVSQNSPQER